MPREEYLSGVRHLLHSRRETDRVALRGVVHPEIVADLSHHDFTRVEAHSDREPEPMLEANLIRVACEFLLKVECRVTPALRVVFVRDWSAEEGHDAVAGVLIDRAFEAVNSLGKDQSI